MLLVLLPLSVTRGNPIPPCGWKLYKILHPDQGIDFGHMLQAVLKATVVSYEALLFSQDMQSAALREDTWFLGWWSG